MFYDWHRTDHHNRQTVIKKALLNSLKALVSTSKFVKVSLIILKGIVILISKGRYIFSIQKMYTCGMFAIL